MADKLKHLSQIYGDAGAREKFEELTAHLIRSERPNAERVRIVRGDGGIDTHEGELSDPQGVDVYQMKFFPEGVGDSQKDQIRNSFKRIHENEDFRTKSWTLCLPIDMSVEEKQWFDDWKAKQAHTGIEIRPIWGEFQLEGLLYQEKNRGLRDAHFKAGSQQVNAVLIQSPNAVIQSPNAVVHHHHTDPNGELDFTRSLLNAGKPDAAEVHLLRIQRNHWSELNKRQRFRVHAQLGHAYSALGDSNQASKHYSLAKDELPDEEEGQSLEALSHSIAGRDAEAYSLACSILTNYPKSFMATAVKIRTAPKNVGFSILREGVHPTIINDVEILNALARRAMTTGDVVEGEKYARSALAQFPEHTLMKGAVATAVVTIEGKRIQRPGGALLTSEQSERLREAERFLSDAIGVVRGSSNRQRLHSIRGQCRELLGNLTEAQADHVIAIELDTAEAAAITQYAKYLARRQLGHEAIRILRRGLDEKDGVVTTFLFSSLLLENGAPEERREAIAALERCQSHFQDLDPEMRDDLVMLQATHTFLVHGLAQAEAMLATIPPTITDDLVRAAIRSDLHLRAGERASANDLTTQATAGITTESSLGHRTRVAEVLGRLQRYKDALDVLKPVATPEQLELVGRMALAAAHGCNDDHFILEYCRKVRESGRWDARCVESEVETLRKYNDIDQAVEITRGFLERAPDERDRRFARLRLSLIGLQSGRSDLIESNPSNLPHVEEVSPNLGRATSIVLLHGPEPIRGVEFAYELVRRHYQHHEAHFALIGVVGIGGMTPAAIPESDTVVLGSAVRFREEGTETDRWVIIENSPNPDIRRDEYPPDHHIAKQLLNKKVGDEFVVRPHPFQEFKGTINMVGSKYLHRAWDSIQRWSDLFTEVPFVFGFRLRHDASGKPDFGPILRTLEEFERNEAAARDWYRDNQVSVLMLAQATRRPTIRVLAFLAGNRELPVRCCLGTAEEFEAGRQVATASTTLVADPVALATLFVTGVYRRIETLPYKLVVCRSAMHELQHFAEEERGQQSDETLIRHEDQPVRLLRPLGSREQLVTDLTAFVQWVTTRAEVRSGVSLTTLSINQRQLLIKLFGQAAAESVAVASVEHIGLWTDDGILAAISANECQVERTWTQLVAERLRDAKMLSGEAFTELLMALISADYTHTQSTPDVLLRAAQVASWDPSCSPFREALEWLSREQINLDGVAEVAILALKLFWRHGALFHQRKDTTVALCQALLRRSDGRGVVLVMTRDVEKIFPLEPLFWEPCRAVLQRVLRS